MDHADDSQAPPKSHDAATEPPMRNLAQAADFMGFSTRRLNDLRRRGEIPAARSGWRGWRFREADLMAYVETAAGVPGVKASAAGSANAATEQPTDANAASAKLKGRASFEETAKLMTAFAQKKESPQNPSSASEEAPLVRMANAILANALDNGASDIHFEPQKENVLIRLRVDGALRQMMVLPKHLQFAMSQRLKVMADVPLFQRQSIHHGSIPVNHAGTDFNIRVSVIPALHGENLVLHLLTRQPTLNLSEQGLSSEARAPLDQWTFFHQGLLLLAGPPGSGLTTTAAAILARRNAVTTKIIAYEAHPEYVIDGVTHTYHPKDSAKDSATEAVIPALLRHNPDMLFLGDLTDAASARAAVDAARAGVLTVATIAAMDSVDALFRLIAYGVTPEDAARLTIGVLAQHLLPRICPDCAGAGCDRCAKTGKRGRIGVFELLPMENNVREALEKRIMARELRENTRLWEWVKPQLLDDARAKSAQGLVSEDSVSRLTALLPK